MHIITDENPKDVTLYTAGRTPFQLRVGLRAPDLARLTGLKISQGCFVDGDLWEEWGETEPGSAIAVPESLRGLSLAYQVRFPVEAMGDAYHLIAELYDAHQDGLIALQPMRYPHQKGTLFVITEWNSTDPIHTIKATI